MSSANQTILSSGLKTLVVAKGRRNGVDGGEWDRMGGMGLDREEQGWMGSGTGSRMGSNKENAG